MRLIAFILAAVAVCSPAAAQEWQEFNYPNDGFAVMLPAAPQTRTAPHEVAEGRSVPAHIYSVRQDKSELTVIVADLANTGLAEDAVIEHAVKKLSATGEMKLNYPHRIYGVYGRQVSLVGKDGSRSMAAMFDVMGRLYQIEAKIGAGGNELDLIRFQQSLVFERGVSNRTEAEIQAIRNACPGRRDAPFPLGGADDPRCSLQPDQE
jgi:hypothetical protein